MVWSSNIPWNHSVKCCTIFSWVRSSPHKQCKWYTDKNKSGNILHKSAIGLQTSNYVLRYIDTLTSTSEAMLYFGFTKYCLECWTCSQSLKFGIGLLVEQDVFINTYTLKSTCVQWLEANHGDKCFQVKIPDNIYTISFTVTQKIFWVIQFQLWTFLCSLPW